MKSLKGNIMKESYKLLADEREIELAKLAAEHYGRPESDVPALVAWERYRVEQTMTPGMPGLMPLPAFIAGFNTAHQSPSIDQQGGAPALLNVEEMAALRRFNETCEDGEGYDVRKPMIQRLASIGAVRRTSGSYYEITDFGMHALGSAPAPAVQAYQDAKDAALFRLAVEKGMQLHFEGGDGEDDAVWVNELMKWSDGGRMGATRALIDQEAKNLDAAMSQAKGDKS